MFFLWYTSYSRLLGKEVTMNRLKSILLTTLLLIILPATVYADCQSDFKAIEKEFEVTYEYNKDTDDFTITHFNPDEDRYVYLSTSKEN